MSVSAPAVFSVVRWIGWRGFIAIFLLVMLMLTNRERDRVQKTADDRAAKLLVAASALSNASSQLSTAHASLNRASMQLRECSSNSEAWSSTAGVINQHLAVCQAENSRLGEDARAARARADAITSSANRGISAASKRFNSASPHCVAALKQMEVSCTGQL